MLSLPPTLGRILHETPELRRSFLVGGCVRDALLGLKVQDYDVEVYGVGYEALAQALSRCGRVDLVGRSFGVVKLTVSGETFDFTVPRRDSKVSAGHKGFEVEVDPELPPAEAAARRDFTINALMWEPRSGALLDHFGGQADLAARTLRHTSAAFTEDPLRVLRGMQFAGRFGLRAAPETAALCAGIAASLAELAPDRIRGEWLKWATKSTFPSAGLRFLRDCGWLQSYPEIAALAGTEQDPDWHPEGDVFVHTCHALDFLPRLPEWSTADAESRAVYTLAVLAHDFGKPATTQRAIKQGRERVVSPGHDGAGALLATAFLDRLAAPNAIRARVPPLVANHLAHIQPPTEKSVRRLASRLAPETIHGLAVVIRADVAGRPPLSTDPPPTLQQLLELAGKLQLGRAEPRPILLGRHLTELGLSPGPNFGTILKAAFEAQLDGLFVDLDGAKAWMASHQTIDPGGRPR